MTAEAVRVRNAKSTTVRMLFFRAVFRALQALSPALAVRLAERLFFTPVRQNGSARVRAFLESGERIDVETGDQRVATWRFGEGPTVLLVHGWSSRGAHLRAFASPLLPRGYSVVTFDHPAHGASSGRLASIPEMGRAIEAVVAAHGPLHGLIAHSLGATAAIHALQHGVSAQRVVLVAPAADPDEFTGRVASLLGWTERTLDAFKRRAERRLGIRWDDLDMRVVAATMTAPALVVHDREDEEVPYHHGDAIAAAWPGATQMETSGLGHTAILRDEEVVSRVVGFLTQSASTA